MSYIPKSGYTLYLTHYLCCVLRPFLSLVLFLSLPLLIQNEVTSQNGLFWSLLLEIVARPRSCYPSCMTHVQGLPVSNIGKRVPVLLLLLRCLWLLSSLARWGWLVYFGALPLIINISKRKAALSICIHNHALPELPPPSIPPSHPSPFTRASENWSAVGTETTPPSPR